MTIKERKVKRKKIALCFSNFMAFFLLYEQGNLHLNFVLSPTNYVVGLGSIIYNIYLIIICM